MSATYCHLLSAGLEVVLVLVPRLALAPALILTCPTCLEVPGHYYLEVVFGSLESHSF